MSPHRERALSEAPKSTVRGPSAPSCLAPHASARSHGACWPARCGGIASQPNIPHACPPSRRPRAPSSSAPCVRRSPMCSAARAGTVKVHAQCCFTRGDGRGGRLPSPCAPPGLLHLPLPLPHVLLLPPSRVVYIPLLRLIVNQLHLLIPPERQGPARRLSFSLNS